MTLKRQSRRLLRYSAFNVMVTIFFVLTLCVFLTDHYLENRSSRMQQVVERGSLRVATLNSPTTYYEGPAGERMGFEFDLAQAFAEHLGVGLELVVVGSYEELIPLVQQGKVDFAAAGIAVPLSGQPRVRFTQPYQEIREQVVDLQGQGIGRPKHVADLDQMLLQVLAGSGARETLAGYRELLTRLNWIEHSNINAEELLELVAEGLVSHAVVGSNEMQAVRHFYPELRVAFSLPKTRQLAWAFRLGEDRSLFDVAEAFLDGIRGNGRLTQFLERYYGHVRNFDYAGTRLYMRRVQSKLPKYRELFKEVAAEHELDWRLLAAMGHQESQWNPRAISPTGVRGMMMLTLTTAAQMGIKNRLDPEQSIRGGAAYLARLHKRLPAEIQEPDRTWMALAAYNVGYGHLRDAQQITVMRDKDPYKWVDVAESLPLLTKQKWYSQVQHGYARGREPVAYVQNIRRYYDILVWTTDKAREAVKAEVEVESLALEID